MISLYANNTTTYLQNIIPSTNISKPLINNLKTKIPEGSVDTSQINKLSISGISLAILILLGISILYLLVVSFVNQNQFPNLQRIFFFHIVTHCIFVSFVICIPIYILYNLRTSYDEMLQVLILKPQETMINYVNDIPIKILEDNKNINQNLENVINNIHEENNNYIINLQNNFNNLNALIQTMLDILIDTNAKSINIFDINMNQIYAIIADIYNTLNYSTQDVLTQFFLIQSDVSPLITLINQQVAINNNIIYTHLNTLLQLLLPINDLLNNNNTTTGQLTTLRTQLMDILLILLNEYQVNNTLTNPILINFINLIKKLKDITLYIYQPLTFPTSDILNTLNTIINNIYNISTTYINEVNTTSAFSYSIYYGQYKQIYDNYCFAKRYNELAYIIQYRYNNYLSIINSYVLQTQYTLNNISFNVYKNGLIFNANIVRGVNTDRGTYVFNNGSLFRQNINTVTNGCVINNLNNPSVIQFASNVNQLAFTNTISSNVQQYTFDLLITDNNHINIIRIVNGMPIVINKFIPNNTSMVNLQYTNSGTFTNITSLFNLATSSIYTFNTNNTYNTLASSYIAASAIANNNTLLQYVITRVNTSTDFTDNYSIYFVMNNITNISKISNYINNNIKSVELIASSVTTTNQYMAQIIKDNNTLSATSIITQLQLYNTNILQDFTSIFNV